MSSHPAADFVYGRRFTYHETPCALEIIPFTTCLTTHRLLSMTLVRLRSTNKSMRFTPDEA